MLQALFTADVDRAGLVHALADLVPELAPDRIAFREVADQDWTRAWMDQFQPMRFGRRLWIYPWNVDPPAGDDAVIVRLDPGLAFGTGTHPTTALCLEWLDAADLSSKTVIDYGCGSGVLAIAGSQTRRGARGRRRQRRAGAGRHALIMPNATASRTKWLIHSETLPAVASRRTRRQYPGRAAA